jgi:hypothetical protein
MAGSSPLYVDKGREVGIRGVRSAFCKSSSAIASPRLDLPPSDLASSDSSYSTMLLLPDAGFSEA